MPQLEQHEVVHPDPSRICDILSDVLTLQTAREPEEEKGDERDEDITEKILLGDAKVNERLRLTFPEIWVDRVCESSEDEEDENFNPKKAPFSSGKQRVIHSLLTSSNDVSFESLGGSSSSSSSRQNSFQLSSRENSVDCTHHYHTEEKDKSRRKQPSTTTAGGSSCSRKESCSLSIDDDFRTPVASTIEDWLREIERHGFRTGAMQAFVREAGDDDEDDDDEDICWFEPGLVRVFDPYYDIEPGEILEVDGGKLDAKTGCPVGLCTVKLHNGDEVHGTFRNGARQGRGSVEGDNLLKHGVLCIKGIYHNGIITGLGMAVLGEGAMWTSVKRRVTLEGVFNNGFLEGPVRGVDDTGNLVFVGQYVKGLPSGNCWLTREGQGWLHGRVDAKGRFSNDDITFVYPDLRTCMVGLFHQEVMIKARSSRITAANLNDAQILCLTITVILEEEPAAVYSYSPSDSEHIACDWLLPDCYESATVECRSSKLQGAGEGIFALRNLPKDRIVAYYNGIRVMPGEKYNTSQFNYQIYVDWSNTDHSAFIDVPIACTDRSAYRASLAHKANHSFQPNCQYVAVDHPRFGRIPGLKTIKKIRRGEELFSHYKYDMALAPNWYQEAWENFSAD